MPATVYSENHCQFIVIKRLSVLSEQYDLHLVASRGTVQKPSTSVIYFGRRNQPLQLIHMRKVQIVPV